MYGMFLNCTRLTSLNVSSFNTANVTKMNNMFNNCASLTELDISNFDMTNVTDMTNVHDIYGIFGNCTSLI
jgi:surface protein